MFHSLLTLRKELMENPSSRSKISWTILSKAGSRVHLSSLVIRSTPVILLVQRS